MDALVTAEPCLHSIKVFSAAHMTLSSE